MVLAFLFVADSACEYQVARSVGAWHCCKLPAGELSRFGIHLVNLHTGKTHCQIVARVYVQLREQTLDAASCYEKATAN